ncbi:hypothetical protein PLESTB_001465300 [Pleodorina starrii]|uniref:Maf-like protein n=1 Tax=Pleodorina starrii TaxID=330485 RepID=A0A9W6BVL8_9CHLO|nr:hypothetical protein PLESTM_001683400 [Pleodorina starrii]GLC59239.1 hypothetical protein PLESTB_001465300 [Pleodorina starrii]GLC74803.1 hypothetical protein PLESTF_001557800 [Pleodorina starrii]
MASSLPQGRRMAVKMVDQQQKLAKLLQTKPRIILGSSSYARRQIMDQLSSEHGFSYEVRTADIDEKAIRDPHPETLVRLLARAKKDAIIAKMKAAGEEMHGLLITCDQVVVHEDRILEKPGSVDEAHEYIEGYGRSPASTVGAVLATDLASGRLAEEVESASIHFRPIPADVRERLVDEGKVFFCAGGLMIEHPLVEPHIERMDGSQCSVMGLPKHLVLRLLVQAAGV